MTVDSKICTKCNQPKPFSCFGKHTNGRDGLRSQCSQCRKEYDRDWRKTHKEHSRACAKKWRDRNRDWFRQYNRRWMRRYYYSNPEKIRQRNIAWRSQHPEYKHAMNVWRKNNPDQIKALHHRRRSRMFGAVGNYSSADIQRLYKTQKGLCLYCGVPMHEKYTVDHKTPLVRKGSNRSSNIALACKKCNSRKGTKTAKEFLQIIHREEAECR